MFSSSGRKKSAPYLASDDSIYSFDRTISNSSNRITTGAIPRTSRLSTGEAGRPMTSSLAAGFSSSGRSAGSSVNEGDAYSKKALSNPDLTPRVEKGPEELIKFFERRTMELIEDSTIAAEEGDLQTALEKSKEAVKQERQLEKQRGQSNSANAPNMDLTFLVLLNLANQYQNCGMYQEALHSYSVIVKNNSFPNGGRLRVNMGNIYFKQKQYPQAIKMYRMALDQISNVYQEFRLKITKNIGIAFTKTNHFQDALTSFESIMNSLPDHESAFYLILCYFATGDKEKMKKGFQKLASIASEDTARNNHHEGELIDDQQLDSLGELLRTSKMAAARYIILAAKLLAPVIDKDIATGYDWMIESVKTSPNSEMASELELEKSIYYLKNRDFQLAINCLKGFEKKDKSFVRVAATNLSFLYYIGGDFENSELYADVAVENDRYNSKAQTNKGNIYFAKGQLGKARGHYEDIIGTDALCAEAMYNLGLVMKIMNNVSGALPWFEKVHLAMPRNPEVIFQIADIHQIQGNIEKSLESFKLLISIVPTDPSILARIGKIHEDQGDKPQALHYFSESYRFYPCDLDVISWLGAYYVNLEVYEQALTYLQRAAIIEPSEIHWHLMVAACQRRIGKYQTALEMYKDIHSNYPENIECLKFLIRMCADLGLSEGKHYFEKLSKLDDQIDASTEKSAVMNGTGISDPLPPSFQRIRPSKQMISTFSKAEKDLFQEDALDYLP